MRQIERVGVEAQRRARQRDLEPGGVLGVADEPIGEPERRAIHRPGRRHADIPIADASRLILDRRLRAGVEHLDRVRR